MATPYLQPRWSDSEHCEKGSLAIWLMAIWCLPPPLLIHLPPGGLYTQKCNTGEQNCQDSFHCPSESGLLPLSVVLLEAGPGQPEVDQTTTTIKRQATYYFWRWQYTLSLRICVLFSLNLKFNVIFSQTWETDLISNETSEADFDLNQHLEAECGSRRDIWI